jgi:flagellar FliL protein
MKKIIIIAAAVVLVLGGGGASVYVFMPDLVPEPIRAMVGLDAKDSKKTVEAKKPEAEVGADLDVFVVNLAGPGPSRYLRTTLSLGVRDEHEKEKIKEMSGKIRHSVIMYLSERKAEELIEPEGKIKLRQELHKQIGEAIGDKKAVTNIYFKEFLIQ